MKKIKITQIKSAIDRPNRQKLTLQALGLNKMNASREVEASPQILGMIRAVNHLIVTEDVANGSADTELIIPATESKATQQPAKDIQVSALPSENISAQQPQKETEVAATNSFVLDTPQEETVVSQPYEVTLNAAEGLMAEDAGTSDELPGTASEDGKAVVSNP